MFTKMINKATDFLSGATASLGYGTPYDGAALGGEVGGNWYTSNNSADNEFDQSGELLRSRSRSLTRNDPFAVSARDAHTNNVIGSRIKLSAKPDYKLLGISPEQSRDWARQVERKFDLFANGFRHNVDAKRRGDLAALMRTMDAGIFVDGEALALVQFDRTAYKRGLKFGTCLQHISIDRLETPDKYSSDRNVRHGIRRNAMGAPTHYYIRKKHPNETDGLVHAKRYVSARTSSRMGRPIVLHAFDQPYAEMSRGVSKFASAIGSMKMLKNYNKTELQRAVTQASYAAVIKTNLPYEKAMEVVGSDLDALKNKLGGNAITALGIDHMQQVKGYHSSAGITMQGARIPHLLPNEELDIKMGSTSNANFPAFEAAFLRQFSAATGIDFASLSKNYSSLPYAAARTALADVWKGYMVARSTVHSQVLQPLFAAWLEEAFLIGEIDLPPGVGDFYGNWEALARCAFIMSGKPQIDPMKERKAQELGLDMGVETLESIAAQDGNDWEERLEQKAVEKGVIKSLKLEDEPEKPAKPGKPAGEV